MQIKFSHILRQERELRGWSQARTAQELGTTPNTISAWERGLSLPSPYFREKLCALLGKNAQELGLLPTEEPIASPQDDNPSLTNYQQTPCGLEATPYNSVYGQDVSSAPFSSAGSETLRSAAGTFRFPLFAGLFDCFSLHRKRTIIVLSCLPTLLIVVAAIVLWPLIISPNPYAPGKGRLVLNDPLKDQGQHLRWQEGWNENAAACQFKRDAYYSTQPLEGYFHACIAQATELHNFAYEVDATIYQGDYAGIIFRATSSLDAKYYLFRVYTDGSYLLKRYVDRVDAHAIPLDSGTVQQFHKGLGQTNKLAVLAEDHHLTLYVNQQVVTSLTDQAYSDGQIGILAGNDQHPPAEAAFRNVRVWSW